MLPMDAEPATHLERLVQVNLDDMVDAFGARGLPVVEPLLRRMGRGAARAFALKVLHVDRLAGERGLRAGSCHGIEAFQSTLEIRTTQPLPQTGPRLFVSNHPGMTDTLALFAAIPGDGLRTLAARRPFLELLPNLSAPLIWLEEGSSSRRAVREAAEHLRAGGPLLTFPAGKIEPDPALYDDAAASLAAWNPSIDLFARLVPDMVIVPTLVSGVIARRAAHSPLRLLRRSRAGKDHLSALLQLSLPSYGRTEARVTFGAPIAASHARGDGPSPVTAAVVVAMRALIAAEGDSQEGSRTGGDQRRIARQGPAASAGRS